jgi:hypothetical protein
MKLPEADPGGHVAKRVCLRPLACRDCGIVPRRGHGRLLWRMLCVVRVEASATGQQ